jgi:hypothetical protein
MEEGIIGLIKFGIVGLQFVYPFALSFCAKFQGSTSTILLI